ncbi:uncharacterized protein LOC144108625 [Amblyomma americanum]
MNERQQLHKATAHGAAGKHCPRHPGRQRKEPLTPWKVAVLKGHLENALKSFNQFICEKISDIEKTAKRYV